MVGSRQGERLEGISAARNINRELGERTGDKQSDRVFADRYHARVLKTPRQVRNTIAYVLNNWRHHGEDKLAIANALPAPEQRRCASREQADVAVNRAAAVENRSHGRAIADVRAAVPHNGLDGRESFIPISGRRARPHDSQRCHRLSAFGLFRKRTAT